MVRKPFFSRELIHSAALKLLAEKGYYGVSIPDIAKASGAATGTIYRYFNSKEALVNELLIESKLLFKQYLFSSVRPDDSFEEIFLCVWQSMMLFAKQEPDRLRFISEHYHGSYLSIDALKTVNQFEDEVQSVLSRFIKDGSGKKELDAELAIALVFGSFHELFKKEKEINDENQHRFESLGKIVLKLF